MPDLLLQLSLSRDEVLRYYQGHATSVRAQATDGRSVQFPADLLRRYVTGAGVQGLFRLRLDQQNRLVSFERIR